MQRETITGQNGAFTIGQSVWVRGTRCFGEDHVYSATVRGINVSRGTVSLVIHYPNGDVGVVWPVSRIYQIPQAK